MWVDDYIGLEFEPNGRGKDNKYDCWGLVRKVYDDELGIVLPSIEDIYVNSNTTTYRNISDVMQQESLKWDQVEAPKKYDVVLMRMHGELTFHVGVYIGENMFLHIMKGINSTVEKTTSLKWQKRIAGYFRYNESGYT